VGPRAGLDAVVNSDRPAGSLVALPTELPQLYTHTSIKNLNDQKEPIDLMDRERRTEQLTH
jgi:hypothetical protein